MRGSLRAIQQEQKIEKKQKEQNKQKLVALEQRKLILMKDISDKKAIIEIM
ncbi:hypothetical protein RJD38_19985 [Vibrio scophthalmi]|uniref:hypothetical protein n=1 Tax=Vibrio scophthalmi TaxID=45658 RepID=UPI00349F229C